MMLHHVRLHLATLMTALALLVVAGAAFAGSFEDAEAARNRGDFATAIQIYRSISALDGRHLYHSPSGHRIG